MYGIFVTCLTLCWAFQRWFPWILSNRPMPILQAKELSPLQWYCLGGGQKWLVPLAELKPVSAGSAKPMPSIISTLSSPARLVLLSFILLPQLRYPSPLQTHLCLAFSSAVPTIGSDRCSWRDSVFILSISHVFVPPQS